MHDLVIRGGHVVDGTGRPGFDADIAIDQGRITAVGSVAARGREEIDARGKLVTPGFVDVHTHYDGQATWDPWVTPSGWHGVTTVVMGNCGVGFAPCRPADRDWLIQVMEGVEDIPGSALVEGIRWGWSSFPEYLDALAASPRAVDVGAQVPHAAVRGWVMGTTRSEQEQATAEEIAAMRALVAEGLRAGALGFSTSRTSLHRTAEGVLVAGTDAAVDELMGIGEALRDVGHGVFGIADEHARVPADATWMTELARRTGRPVIFNLSQFDQGPSLWREGLAAVEAAGREGVPLYAQAAGRAIGIVMCWRGTAHPFALTQAFWGLRDLPWDELKVKLADPAIRRAILDDTPIDVGAFQTFVTRTFAKMFVLDEGFSYEPDPADSLAARAAREGRPPEELAYDALMAHDATGMLYFPLFNYAGGDLAPLEALHRHPRIMMGLSDGGAHCGAIADAGMPTFMLTHWARDRRRGPRLPLEHMVKRQTRDTAAMYGMLDRGVVATGYKADLNVIDWDRLALRRPEMAWDLPAGGRRLLQRSTGYVATVLNGVVTLRDGEVTGAMPGGLVRGPQAPPAS